MTRVLVLLCLIALFGPPARPAPDAIPAETPPATPGLPSVPSGNLRARTPATGSAGTARPDASPRAGSGLSLRGSASWYRVPGLTAAAGPELRQALGKGWRGARVTVCADRCVTVRLVDWCQCYRGERRERLVDLSDGAFSRLAPLPVGIVRVRIVTPEQPASTPPATDAE